MEGRTMVVLGLAIVCLFAAGSKAQSLRSVAEESVKKSTEFFPDVLGIVPLVDDLESVVPKKIDVIGKNLIPGVDLSNLINVKPQSPLDSLFAPVNAIKDTILSFALFPTKTTTAAPIDATAPVVAESCEGNISVEFGDGDLSVVTEGKLLPVAKLALLNPALLGFCGDVFTPQCKWGYVFPNGVVGGVDEVNAEYAVMMYVLSTKTWALLRAHITEPVVAYSSSVDVDELSPDLSTSYPWLTGPGGVFTNSQSVQSITCVD
eukprot:GHVS01004280.1.p1 GENE.GHVS01004280.1~~GHVS01004280.1.p1  ORF type:complete len:262 (+),score=33.45 GHVS01004280.1:171-956(+)